MKLDVNILDHRKIRLIRRYSEGDTLFTLWVGIMCIAMRQETDTLYIASDIPYTPEDLANTFNIDLNTVKLGLELFQRYEMIEMLEDGAIHIPGIEEHQSLDKLAQKRELNAERQRRYRQRQQDNAVTRNAVISNADRLEKTRVDKNKNTSPVGDGYSNEFENIWQAYPRKVNKRGAYKAFRARKRDGIETGELQKAVTNYARHCKDTGKEETYVMHGATFFGPNDRWVEYRDWKPKRMEFNHSIEVVDEG